MITNILSRNLQTILNTPDNQNFLVDRKGLLKPTDKATSEAAKDVIKNTLTEAAHLELSNKRIWIELGTKGYSLGHLFHEKAGLVPQEVQTNEFSDETIDLLEVKVNFGRSGTYTSHVAETDLKQCAIFANLLDDLGKPDPQENFSIPIPYKQHKISKNQLDLAFQFIKTGDLPDNLSVDDSVALLKFANYLDFPTLQHKTLDQLCKMPLAKEPFLSLPYELAIKWAIERPLQECLEFIRSFQDHHAIAAIKTFFSVPTNRLSFLSDIGVELINKKPLVLADFDILINLKNKIDCSSVKVLNLSKWRDLSPEQLQEVLKSFPNIVELKLPSQIKDQIRDEHLEFLGKLSSLKELDLYSCEHITEAGLAHLQGLKSLKKLNLSLCTNFANRGLEHLKELSSLESLKLSNCRQITGEGLAHLDGISSLKEIYLDGCSLVTNEGLAHLKELVNLEILDLGYCSQMTNVGLAYLKQLPKLRVIDLTGCNHISDEGLSHLKELSSLKEIDLYGCTQVTDVGLGHLKKLTKLQALTLANCSEITNGGLAHLNACKELRKLSLYNLNQMTDEGLCDLIEGHAQLQILRVANSRNITDRSLASCKTLTDLKELSLHQCSQITGSGLEHLKGLKDLQNLTLAECDNLTESHLAHLNAFTADLKELSLGENPQVTNATLEHLRHFKNLQQLILLGCGQITHEAKDELKQLLPQLTITG